MSTMSIRPRMRPALKFVAWGVLLGLAYGQAPLYTSNQNQYFLHGLAQAGQGLLAYSLRRIADRLFGLERSRTARWVFLALIFVTHSAALRGLGGEWQYLFDGGLAGQRLLGTVLQPSSFGVFLLLSLQQFLDDRPYRAVLAAALAATVHPTYLLSAAVLTFAYIFVELRAGKELKRTAQIGGLALILVVPVLAYSVSSFLPSGADAREVLVHFRLPAHALVSEWFGAATVATAMLIGLALYLARGTKLWPVLLISTVVGATLTLLQLLTGNDALALLFPWRLSTYLVPISVAVLVGWFSVWLLGRTGPRFGRIAPVAGMVVIGLSILSGVIWMAVQGLQERIAPENALYEYVRGAREPEQIYAIPPRLQDFRLETGAPILADFKSIPYRRGEVISWHDRVRLLQWFYRDEIDCGLMEDFIGEFAVTHMVLGPEQVGQDCPEMTERYNDGYYAVYELAPTP
jgi:hypothetical protein